MHNGAQRTSDLTAKPAAESVRASAEATPLHEHLEEIVARFRDDHSGAVATYIPQLASADPNWFGVCLVTVDGAAYEAGDSRQPFTIQSISKPLAYGLALEQRGTDLVASRVGVEPSGEAFNSISLAAGSGRPLNPMINAGAIAVSSLVNDTFGAAALEGTLEWFAKFAGRPLEVDGAVYESERATGHRNRAIAHLLRNFDVVGDDVEEGLDLYFRQCSILVTCHDLAVMAATLANHGVNPITGERAISGRYVEDVLSVMTTCGMYNYAGQWLYDVGVPAKSGVAGGILAVLPGRMGIGVFSPRLDEQGNSVRGVRACRELSERFGLHLFGSQRTGGAVVRHEMTLASRASSRVRPELEARTLKSAGGAARMLELQGDLHFSSLEVVQRRVWAALSETRILLLDFSRVTSVDRAAADAAAVLSKRLNAQGIQVVFAGLKPVSDARVRIEAACPAAVICADADRAIEACEDGLLTGRPVRVRGRIEAHDGDDNNGAAGGAAPQPLAVAELEVSAALTAAEQQRLAKLLVRVEVDADEPICRRGDAPQHIYFLARGTVSVRLYSDEKAFHRLAVFAPGSVFGEIAVIDKGPRSADVWSESPVTLYAMAVSDFDAIEERDPPLKIKLLRYLLRIVTLRLRRANDLIAQLS